jgi:hypothetical protein
MSVQSTTQPWTRQLSAVAVTLIVAVTLPLLVHLLPPVGGAPLGARLLPIFIAPLLAVIFFRPLVAVLASLAAPLLNHLLIGMPPFALALLITVELAVFTLVFAGLHLRRPGFLLAAPLAYLAGMAAAVVVLFITPLIPAPPFAYFTDALVTAVPGILLLMLIHWAALRLAANRNH